MKSLLIMTESGMIMGFSCDLTKFLDDSGASERYGVSMHDSIFAVGFC